jgi:aryl-alcohol dehydrogenase-like predicted oxidoreductase
MRYRQLGRSGLTVSVVGLGCNNFGGRLDLEASRAVVDAAVDAGVTLLDTADVYGNRFGHVGGSEAALGEILGSKRDKVVLATKFGMDMGYDIGVGGARASRRYIRHAVEQSLARLQTDRIDLYQLHAPDGLTPLEETLGALDELIREGKVLYAGSSNLAAWQVADADAVARREHFKPFISAQNHYSLLERGAEAELLPACAHFGVGVLPYFPLSNGLLTGKYRRSQPAPEGSRLAGQPIDEKTFDRVEALEGWAADHGRSLLELAVAGLAARPPVASVIAGATRPEQVTANVAGADWDLSDADLDELDSLT